MKILVAKNNEEIIISKNGKRLVIDKANKLFDKLNKLFGVIIFINLKSRFSLLNIK